ncbi:threonine ammonia-lyase IlvA [Candidatus Saccharibacteria bacterium]|nr:threonine ammonia-lyase IlvA [Candidatus Saccharibacteria bacterium]
MDKDLRIIKARSTVDVTSIEAASVRITGVSSRTHLQYCERLSSLYDGKVFLKREDTQPVRSYKIRGAYNLISSLSEEEKKCGIITASAGNHAQGVALSAKKLKINATIFMPTTTPLQKINRVKVLGGHFIKISLVGDNFDECNKLALETSKQSGAVYVPPFDDHRTISGQGTVAKEIYDELGESVDVVVCPIGGGGLIAGVSTYFNEKDPTVQVVGVEPEGAASMYESLKQNKVVSLDVLDTFVDGVAVKRVGAHTFKIVKKLVKRILVVPVGKVCSTMIELYQEEGIITEPAGALSVSALDSIADLIKGKTVVCIISGGNNDIMRYPEIMERNLIYRGLKHYFLVKFAQKPGQLRAFVDKALGPNDDIVRFEYLKKSSKEKGPALIGIELVKKGDFKPLVKRMDQIGLDYQTINDNDMLYTYLV